MRSQGGKVNQVSCDFMLNWNSAKNVCFCDCVCFWTLHFRWPVESVILAMFDESDRHETIWAERSWQKSLSFSFWQVNHSCEVKTGAGRRVQYTVFIIAISKLTLPFYRLNDERKKKMLVLNCGHYGLIFLAIMGFKFSKWKKK